MREHVYVHECMCVCMDAFACMHIRVCVFMCFIDPPPFNKRGGGSQNFGGPKGGGRKIFLKRGGLGQSLGVSKKGGGDFWSLNFYMI